MLEYRTRIKGDVSIKAKVHEDVSSLRSAQERFDAEVLDLARKYGVDIYAMILGFSYIDDDGETKTIGHLTSVGSFSRVAKLLGNAQERYQEEILRAAQNSREGE